MLSVRVALPLVFSLFVSAALFAQAWVPDLKKEDAAALDKTLLSLGTTYRDQPLLSAYLATGKNSEFVELLLKKGCNPNQKDPTSGLSPLALVVTRNLGPRLVSTLLQGGASLDVKVPGAAGNLIEVALDRQEYPSAALLLRANQRNLPKSRLVLTDQFKDYAPFLLDDLVSVRNVLRYGDLNNTLVWNLALAGNSRKVLSYLLELQLDAHLNVPGGPDENTLGLDLLANDVDLLGYLLANGLAATDVDFDQLYLRLFQARSLDAVQALKALDAVRRPTLDGPALGAGLEFLKIVTNNLADLSTPEFLQSPGALGILEKIEEQSDFGTIAPLVRAANSDALVTGLYQYALVKKDVPLVRSLVAYETPRIRPELYADAMKQNLDLLKALTHELADLRTPELYADSKQSGREGLITVLLKSPQGGKTLLERIYEKSDFQTILALIQPLNPGPELLKGKSFSADYQQWLTRGNKEIVAFGFLAPGVLGTIQGDQISATLPAGTDPHALVAVFTLSGGLATVVSVPQVSGTTANDFSRPVTYEVTARDGSKKTYLVTVTVTPPPAQPPTGTP